MSGWANLDTLLLTVLTGSQEIFCDSWGSSIQARWKGGGQYLKKIMNIDKKEGINI